MNVGIIGCGSIVHSLHLPVLSRIPGINIRWLCDASLERARRVARDWKIQHAFSHVDECSDVDAVLVATPVATRRAVLDKTTARGWHAFCEKPFALSAAEHRHFLSAARESEVKLGAGYMRRHYWAVERARHLVETQFLGSIQSVIANESAHLDRIGVDTSSYRNDRHASGGGILIETGCHLIDEVLFITGASDVHIAECNQKISMGYEVETVASGSILCTPGGGAALDFVLSGIQSLFEGIAIQCERGELLLGLDPGQSLEITLAGGSSRPVLLQNPMRLNHLQHLLQAFHEEWLHFLDAINEEQPWDAARETGLLTSEVIDQCKTAALPSQTEVRECVL